MISITKAMFRLAIILIMTCIAGMTAAQEYNFAQYYLDKLGISPAFVSVGDYKLLDLANLE